MNNNINNTDYSMKYFFNVCRNTKEIAFLIFKPDGSIFSYNKAFLSFSMKKKKDLEKLKIYDLVPISKKEIHSVTLDHDLTKYFVQSDYQYQIYLGQNHSINNSGNKFLLVTKYVEPKHYLNNSILNIDQLKKIINQFKIGMVILNENYEVIEANPMFCKNLGYTIKEVLRLRAQDYVYKFDSRRSIQNNDKDQIYYFGEDNYHIKKDGTLIPINGYVSMTTLNDKEISICLYENIGKIKDFSERFKHSEMLIYNLIRNSSEVVLVLNQNLEMQYLSVNTKSVFKYIEDISESEINRRYLPLQKQTFKEFIKNNFEFKNHKKEYEYSIKDNRLILRYFSVKTFVLDSNEKLIICYIRDITENKNYIEELKALSYRDQLTGLHNRQFMEEQLLELRKSDNYPISIISCDLDGLKEVNDSLGHQAGDQLLILFANILLESHDKDEEIFRIGGDEFIIISTNTNKAKANAIVNKINSKIHMLNSIPGSIIKISVSIGFSTTNVTNMKLNTMLALADKEMYIVKNNKKIINS